MEAPFPWFGGKSRITDIVWARFGDVPNYIEPFAGSLAVLLGRPTEPKIETVNDIDCYLSNFWRAVKADHRAVAEYANWPVNEADLNARHRWLVDQAEFRERMNFDPSYYDARIAGWWVWGISSWIGRGWCATDHPVWKSRPHLGDAGKGVHSIARSSTIIDIFAGLCDRLRRVRVCCGDWARVLAPGGTSRLGMTAIFLDPPYDYLVRSNRLYSRDGDFSMNVRQWAIEHGSNPLLRIALCGYQGEHEMPDEWDQVAWKATGGYAPGGFGRGRQNSNLERIWFSPACAQPQPGLFDEISKFADNPADKTNY
jgi:DNA adenine methylase